MSADASNYDLQNVECKSLEAQLQYLIKITKVRKGSGVACVFSNQLPHVL